MSDVTYTSRELLTWLWRDYLKKHMWVLLVAVIFMSIEASTMGGLAKLMQPMFDQVFVAGEKGALLWVGLMLVGIFVLRAVSGVVQKVLLTRIKQKSAADMRIDLLDRMMVQDGAFHQQNPPGFLIQRVQSDVNAIGSVWQAVITGAGRDLIGLIVLLGVAISIDPVWALLACIGLPLMVMPAALAQRFVRARSREARDLGATLSTRLDEVFHGIVQIKLNALEKYQAKQYRDLTRTYIRTEVRASFGNSAIPGMIDIISGRRLGAISGLWQTAAAALERLKELMDEPVHLTSPAKPTPVPTTPPHIALEGVSLSYGDAKVLDNLTLHAAAGETTALVGASGAGKSTIFNLLTRLIDPQEGNVSIAGVPLTEMDIPALRGLFSVVTQEALLFDETLRENIVLGRENVSDEELQQALDAAHVSDFLPKLEHGLETRVGPRGSALSGGQRQRVVIARALLRNTPILLLDEATSALDAQSEKVVQQALDRLSQGRTTLVIAHRLSTIRGADKIVVMDRGRVMDEGKHEDLLARGGIYADLYRLQFEDGKTVSDGRNLAAMRRMERGLKPVEPNLLQRIGLRLFGN